MSRYATVSTVLVLLFIGAKVHGQDSDEIKKLKDRIELLETKLKLAELETATLKKQIETMKQKPEPVAKENVRPTLSDVLQDGAIFKGDYKWTNRKAPEGESVLTITKREGKHFKGIHVAIVKNDGTKFEREIEGTLSGNRIEYHSVNTSDKFTIKGVLKGESLDIDYVNQDGGRATGTFKVPK